MAWSVTATYGGGIGEAPTDESMYCGQKKIPGLGVADSARKGVAVASPLLFTTDKREDRQQSNFARLRI
jgi:hypothetical protein